MSATGFKVDREHLEVRLTRDFQVAPQRLWRALVDPALIPRWWGPRELSTVIDRLEVRVGGGWRITHVGGDGRRHVFYGVFREVDEPRRLVRTFEYEPQAGHVLLETATLEELPRGGTRLTTVTKYELLQDLDGMVGAGMERGATESMERLAELVERVRV